jgi:hypothetical protein
MIRVPSHLRLHVANYDLEGWVDGDCPLEEHFKTIELLEDRLNQGHHTPGDTKVRDAALVALIAICLDEEMELENHVINSGVTGYDLTKEGAFVPILQAAGWLILRRYRGACAKEEWPLPSTEPASIG